jgi:hypothetical protein
MQLEQRRLDVRPFLRTELGLGAAVALRGFCRNVGRNWRNLFLGGFIDFPTAMCSVVVHSLTPAFIVPTARMYCARSKALGSGQFR